MRPEFHRVDPILETWAKKFGLHIYRAHQDVEVRAVTVVDDSSDQYGIWIDPLPNDFYEVGCAWRLGRKVERKRVTKEWKTVSSRSDLASALDRAYETVDNWIRENGQTRTWKW
jgi:hypothetical protein